VELMSGHHGQPMRYPYTGDTIDIDDALVPVMELLWARGIETTGSCQGTPGIERALICFREPRGFWESPDYPDDLDINDPADDTRYAQMLDAWLASRPDGARQVVAILAKSRWAHMAARWLWTFGDDPGNVNDGSAVLLPTDDLPLLAAALTEDES
jgi:hypothetical protein